MSPLGLQKQKLKYRVGLLEAKTEIPDNAYRFRGQKGARSRFRDFSVTNRSVRLNRPWSQVHSRTQRSDLTNVPARGPPD
jgi:hypothetical protein